MKTKGIIKLINSINDLFKSAIELEKRQIEKLAMTPKPIPDYKKGSINKPEIIQDSIKYQEHIFDNPKAKEDARSHLMDAFEMALKKGDIKFPDNKQNENVLNEIKNVFYEGGFRSGKTQFYEEWSKQLNKFLKEKGLNDSQPFGFAPVDGKEVSGRFLFSKYLDEKIMSDLIKNKKQTQPDLSSDFNEQMLKADKELQRVCKPKIDCENNCSPIPKDDFKYCSFERILPKLTINDLKTVFVNGIEYNLEYKGNGNYLIKDPVCNTDNKKLKNRQIEIGKEIEKLRIEARQIKKSLKG